MLKIQSPLPGDSRVLLHSCCAPCSSAIVECMMANGLRPTVFYYNPNIYPREEYDIRKQEAIRFTTSLGLDFVDADDAAWRASPCASPPLHAMPPGMASGYSPPPWPPRAGKASTR